MQRIVQQSLMKRIGGAAAGRRRLSSRWTAPPTLPYTIPNIRVEYIETDPGIPYGFWRSVGASVQGYVVEAFIDEMATAAGKDPYQFRRDLLGKAPRHRAVLDLVAEKVGLGHAAAAGPRARHRRDGMPSAASSAQVAEVSVTKGAVTGSQDLVRGGHRLGRSIPTRSRRRWKAAPSTG